MESENFDRMRWLEAGLVIDRRLIPPGGRRREVRGKRQREPKSETAINKVSKKKICGLGHKKIV